MQNGNGIQLKGFFRNKWVQVALAVDVVAIIVVIFVMIWNANKNVTLTINVTPLDAVVQIGGDVYSNGIYKFHPGEYEVMVSHDGFESKKMLIELSAGDSVDFATFLKGEGGDFEYYTYSDHYGSYAQLADIASKERNRTYDNDTSAEEFVSTFSKNYDLMTTELPLLLYDYVDNPSASPRYKTLHDISIEALGNSECEKTLCVKIVTRITDDGNYATNALREKGFNLEMFEVRNESAF